VEDSFLELGGTSIQAARVAYRAQEQTGKRVTVNTVLRHLTIAQLCAHLATQPAIEAAAPPPEAFAAIAAAPVLSFGQEQMLILHTLDPGSSQYNQPLALAIHGEVDAALLQRSLQALIARHAPLRTVYKPSLDGATWAPLAFPASGAPAAPAFRLRPCCRCCCCVRWLTEPWSSGAQVPSPACLPAAEESCLRIDTVDLKKSPSQQVRHIIS